MKALALLMPLLILLLTPQASAETTPWIGSIRATASRAVVHPCAGGAKFEFGMWDLQRASITAICFEVYQQGVTDWDNPDAWKMLNVQLHYRFSKSAPFRTMYVNIFDRDANNLRYVFDYRQFNPFYGGYFLCPSAAEVTIYDEIWGERAQMEFYLTVNNASLGSEVAPYTMEYGYSPKELRRKFCETVPHR